MSDRKIRVLVVDDSNVVRTLLTHILNSDPRIDVVGTAANGRDALEQLPRRNPDVIVMDIDMPEMDGFEATRRIMETRPVPIIICSASTNPRETITTFRSMEAGAVACIEKPIGHEHKDFEAMVAQLLETVKLMSEVKVVRRWSRLRSTTPPPPPPPMPGVRTSPVEIIGIGASTGGPPVLQTILTGLPKDFPVPLLIVQHIAPGFLPGLVEWLNQTTGAKVQIASYGARPLPGQVYLAPDDFHLGIRGGGQMILTREEPDGGLRPSVSHLFRTLADVAGHRAVGVLLTGMGKDGAAELKRMRDRGATTIVQDRETSVVHGMPGEALSLGAATYTLPAERIAPALVALVTHKPVSEGGPT